MKKTFALSVATVAVSMLALAAPALAATISTQMDIGTTGPDVSVLQQTLAADSSLYPQGLVTGYFGPLTSAAVARFQAQQGLPQVGRVGPLTLAKFNAVYGNGVSTNSAPSISNITLAPNSNGMGVMWNTDQPASGVVYYSTSPLVVTEASGPGQAPGITGTNVQTFNTQANTANSAVLSNLAASTTYYYTIESVNASGKISMTWPSTFKTN